MAVLSPAFSNIVLKVRRTVAQNVGVGQGITANKVTETESQGSSLIIAIVIIIVIIILFLILKKRN